ncbi:sensor protein KdpD [Pedobacter ureilyticus]|uniref:Sensor protein KdpD n=1 Tax=Pedobacter ureilyticus TaxID=1393051 RepID=A0ABW9J0C1_9SPHI|nr:sensor protein KdpD [Pedobacter helvus]
MTINPTTGTHFLDLLQQAKRGRLKIYLGMSAGVGKTYRMLQEAHSLLQHHIDVQLAYIETHGRAETVALSRDLPTIPRKKSFHKGKELEELDLQAVLIRHPEVVLVDELAHHNIPGSKNEKRWQDVVDILNAGISVITAVNIQHLEGLNALMQQITGISISETIPDQLFKLADEVVNIDLSVDELIDRLKAGKIYHPDKINQALQHFFKKETIIQLREQALSTVASYLDQKISDNKLSNLKQEHFLACISSNEKTAQMIIRKTSRLASYYRSTWTVVYVQTESEQGDKIRLDKQRHLINNFKLATELGAEVMKIKSNDVASTILKVVNDKKITTLCIGQPHLHWLKVLFGNQLLNKLLKNIAKRSIDLVILS